MTERARLRQADPRRPAEAVARLRIYNPEKRNALDHEILDAIAEPLPRARRGHRDPLRDHHRHRQCLLRRLRHRRHPRRGLRSRRPRRSSPTRSTRRSRRSAPSPSRRSPRSTATRSAAASSWRVPCDLRVCARRGEARHAAGEARPDLQPHGPAQVHRRRSAPPAPASCSSPGATSTPTRAEQIGPRQRGRRRRTRWRTRRSSSRPRSPPTRRSRWGQQARDRGCSRRAATLTPEQERELIELRESCFALRGLPRGRPRLRREAQAKMEGAMTTEPGR